MDRIDHYPYPNDDSNEANLGRVAGEVAALRDQQETFYYRNDAVNRTQEIINKPPSLPAVRNEINTDCIGIRQINQLAVNHYKLKDANQSTHNSDVGCAGMIAFLFISIFVAYLVISLIQAL